jgi:hypothetical protein
MLGFVFPRQKNIDDRRRGNRHFFGKKLRAGLRWWTRTGMLLEVAAFVFSRLGEVRQVRLWLLTFCLIERGHKAKPFKRNYYNTYYTTCTYMYYIPLSNTHESIETQSQRSFLLWTSSLFYVVAPFASCFSLFFFSLFYTIPPSFDVPIDNQYDCHQEGGTCCHDDDFH